MIPAKPPALPTHSQADDDLRRNPVVQLDAETDDDPATDSDVRTAELVRRLREHKESPQ